MGKKSLIKSTDKKTATRTKTTSPEKSGSSAKAPAKQKTATPGAKVAAKTKKIVKKPSPKKVGVTKKKITIKDLLFKKFKTTSPGKKFSPADFAQTADNFTAPPFIFSDNDKDNRKIRKLLFNTYSMNALKVAAEKAAAEKAA
ncbi:MAG: hypothetical protein B6I22_12370, partial [Desulfobacteraceae bacterium 4572_123]